MLICDSCKQQISSDQLEQGKSFPAFTLMGGFVSAAGAAATGMFILVPAGIVLGALADKSSRRCGMCSSEIGQDESSYHLMEELGEDRIGRSYRPVNGAASPGLRRPQHSNPDQFAQCGHPCPVGERATPELRQIGQDEKDMSFEMTFREQEGRLVPADPRHSENQDELGLVDDSITGLDLGADGGQLFQSGGETARFANDGFASFDDPAVDIESLDGFDDPLVGECSYE